MNTSWSHMYGQFQVGDLRTYKNKMLQPDCTHTQTQEDSCISSELLACNIQFKTKSIITWVSPKYSHEVSGWYLQPLRHHQFIATVCLSLGWPIVELEIVFTNTIIISSLQFLNSPRVFLKIQYIWLTFWNRYIVETELTLSVGVGIVWTFLHASISRGLQF